MSAVETLLLCSLMIACAGIVWQFSRAQDLAHELKRARGEFWHVPPKPMPAPVALYPAPPRPPTSKETVATMNVMSLAGANALEAREAFEWLRVEAIKPGAEHLAGVAFECWTHAAGEAVRRMLAEETAREKATALKPSEPRHPIQPLAMIDNVLRFKKNAIVRDLLDHASKHGLDLNVIAANDYSDDDRQQFAQLIGTSLSGYGDLPYVSDDDYETADAMFHAGMSEIAARADVLQSRIDEFRDSIDALREPIAKLFEMHAEDLARDG